MREELHIDTGLMAEVEAQARRHGRSVDDEATYLLRDALNRVKPVASPPLKLGSRIAARFADCGLEDCDLVIDRGGPIEPMRFDT